MKITEMGLPGAFRIEPEKHFDRRGYFYEALTASALSEAIGYPYVVRQANYSVSARNTVRGIHSTALQPGQAKLVTCVRGAALDVAVDLRVGSPTFGAFEVTEQDENSGIAVYLKDGLGHAFIALTDDTCMSYLCSEEYVPTTMIEVDPLDPDIGIPWNLTEPPIISDKDARAPGLQEAARTGLVPTYQECLTHYASLAESAGMVAGVAALR